MKKSLLTLFAISIFLFTAKAQMVITHDSSMTQLVNNFILTGVSASNIVYTGAISAIGSFTGGNSTNLGLNDGIILTTGSIDSVPYINDTASKFANTNNSQPGDSLLNTYCPYPSYDAAVLEFDLVPVGNMLEFQYVFGSEEYPEYVGMSFNDIFGFFISGINPIGGNYSNANIALIPNTTMPVCINNVNDTSNSLYFVNNANGTTIIFDGFTTVLVAQAAVIPGTTYHLKMALADVGDNIFDSGIFLKAKSMKSYMLTGVEENATHNFNIAPNPLKYDSKLTLNMLHPGKVMITISDISGKEVYSSEKSFITTGPQTFSLNKSNDLKTSGIFIIRVETDDFTEMQKIVK
jgi:hypothetical protein